MMQKKSFSKRESMPRLETIQAVELYLKKFKSQEFSRGHITKALNTKYSSVVSALRVLEEDFGKVEKKLTDSGARFRIKQ